MKLFIQSFLVLRGKLEVWWQLMDHLRSPGSSFVEPPARAEHFDRRAWII